MLALALVRTHVQSLLDVMGALEWLNNITPIGPL
jgi:hypothetical protein